MASATYRVCTLPGDGIGPEIIAEGKKVLAAVGARHDVEFVCEDHLIGGAAIDATSEAGGPVSALPPETLEAARAADAVLLAAVGGPKWTDTKVGAVRPEQGLLAIRKELGLYLNLRPVRMFDALIDASTLKREVLTGVDLIIVRELTGGLYFGGHERTMGVEGAGVGGGRGEYARDVLEYSEYEVDRVVRWAFDAARRRRGVVHSVDKANVLDTSRMWREVAHNIAREYPDVRLEDMYVDNAAMQLIANPAQFDVLVTENTFGDILSDEASHAHGLARHARLCEPRRRHRALRAEPRVGARHRRAGHRQPDCADPLGGADASLQLWHGRRGRRARRRGHARARRGLAYRRHR